MKNSILSLTVILLFFAVFMSAFAPVSGYKVGDKATDFSLKNVDGKMVSLADYKDAKGFIVIFTCNHCPFAKGYEDRIIALHNKYAPKGYPVVAINTNAPTIEDDNFVEMQKRAKSKSFPFAYLADETQSVGKAYGAAKTPHSFVLTKKGNDLIIEYIGGIDDNAGDAGSVNKKYVEQAVDEILSGKAVTTKETKAIGCGIKYKSA